MNIVKAIPAETKTKNRIKKMNTPTENNVTRPVKVDVAGTIEHLDNEGVIAKATEHSAASGRAWLVNPSSDSTGMPLDWSVERSIAGLAAKGFIVIPKPGQTIDDLKAEKMLRD